MNQNRDDKNVVSFTLTDKDKKDFEEKINKITPEDVMKVKTQFGKKLDELEKWMRKSPYMPDFVATLIQNVKLLYELLCDEDYTTDWKTKSTIAFALLYFISPIDAIPDFVPVVGYLDDAVVVAWVIHILSDEIQRYKAALKARVQSTTA